MSRLEQQGGWALSAVLYFSCSPAGILLVSVSVTVVQETIAVEFGISVRRRSLRQAECGTIEGSTLSGPSESAAVAHET